MAIVREAVLADIDAVTLYRILQLRTDVFVVEQNCPYAELDGRDLEPAARQLWIERDDHVVATLRLLLDDDGAARIGRVATASSARGSGLAAVLMRRALQLVPGVDVVLDAQTYLSDWYAQFGFVRDGADYVEDGIPHVPMRRKPASDQVFPSDDRKPDKKRFPGGKTRSTSHSWPAVIPSDPVSDDPATLGMQAHPEGGWFRETWRHAGTVMTPRGERPLATSVSFLLRAGERSAWHRVASDELWVWQGGGPARINLGGSGDTPGRGETTDIGPGDQLLVPADTWQSAEPAGGRAVLVACIVSPGFDFADFTLAEPADCTLAEPPTAET